MSLPGWALLLYAVLWATLFRALLIRANVVSPRCGRCGRALERRELGERVCSCASR